MPTNKWSMLIRILLNISFLFNLYQTIFMVFCVSPVDSLTPNIYLSILSASLSICHSAFLSVTHFVLASSMECSWFSMSTTGNSFKFVFVTNNEG